jgi:hypothetical protein
VYTPSLTPTRYVHRFLIFGFLIFRYYELFYTVALLPLISLYLGLSTGFLICAYLLLACIFIFRQFVCTYQYFQSPVVVHIFCIVSFCLCLFAFDFFLYTLFLSCFDTSPVYVYLYLPSCSNFSYLYYFCLCIFDMTPLDLLTMMGDGLSVGMFTGSISLFSLAVSLPM